ANTCRCTSFATGLSAHGASRSTSAKVSPLAAAISTAAPDDPAAPTGASAANKPMTMTAAPSFPAIHFVMLLLPIPVPLLTTFHLLPAYPADTPPARINFLQ